MPFTFDPSKGMYNAYDAVQAGQADSNALAQQRAQMILSQIEAQRKNELIDAELLNNKIRTEAYAKQVAQMGQPKSKLETTLQQAQGGLAQQQMDYAPLMAMMARAKQNPAAWNEFINRPGNEHLRELLGDQFDSEAVGAYTQGIMPNNPAKLSVANTGADAKRNVAGLNGLFGNQRQNLINQGKVQSAQIMANKPSASQPKPLNTDQLYSALSQKKAQGIPLSPQEEAVLKQIEDYKAASALRAPGQNTPKIDLGAYGVPTTTPAQQREKTEGTTQQKKPLSQY